MIKATSSGCWGARLVGLIALALTVPFLLSQVSNSPTEHHYGRRLKAKWTPAKYLQRIRGDKDVVAISHRAMDAVPSYLGICSALLRQAEGKEVKPVKVREEKTTCSGKLGVTESLTRIIISSWLVAQGRAHFALKIDYQHQCGRFENTFIHSLLPPKPIPKGSRYSATERDDTLMFCQNALLSHSAADPEQIEHIISQQIPMVRASIEVAMEAAKKKAYIPKDGIFSTLDNRQPSVVAETAVIHLPCIDRWCNNILVLPFHVYLTNIPTSVRAIDVVVPPELSGNYREHALDLIGTLRKFNPRTKVEFVEGYPFQAQIYSRFMMADYVFCGPGGGMACLFPILSQPSEGSTTAFKILDSDTASFLNGMLTPTPLTKYEVIEHPPPQSFRFLQAQPEGGFRHWAYSQPGPVGCSKLRGRFGHWVQDENYARTQAQYATPLLHHSGASDQQFRQQNAGAVRPSTTYKWQEILYPSCAVAPIPSRDSFCEAMQARGIRRIFFLGDSLTLQMALSLWMILTPDQDIPLEDESYMRRSIQCPINDYQITLEYVRNDELLENDQPVSLPKQIKNCHHFCYPWKEVYANDPRRTVAVVNIGSHLHSRELFNAAMPRFVAHFDSLQRPNDLVMLRTLVPGHKNCGEPGLKPYENFGQYATAVEGAGGKDTYNWNILSTYNDLMAKMVEERRINSHHVARMELLDVFPMTVLRPDGHIADEFKVTATRKTDCLHYSLPGPPDWWNHLLFDQVKSMVL